MGACTHIYVDVDDFTLVLKTKSIICQCHVHNGLSLERNFECMNKLLPTQLDGCV